MTTLLAAAIGLLLGHALDIFFNRLYTGEPLGGPIHRCHHCRSRLRSIYLIPILGVAWSRGRCRDCGRRLPLRTFLLAAGAVALFAASDLVFDSFGQALLAGFFATVFLVLTFTDLESRLIPNRVVYPSILLAAALSWVWPDISVKQVFAGGVIALILTSLIFIIGRGAFGLGDVKMSLLMGLVVGLPSVVVGIFTGMLASGAFILPMLLLRILHRRDYIAYGPFIAVGAVIALFWGDSIWDWYVER